MHCWKKQSVTCEDEKSKSSLLMIKVTAWGEILPGVLHRDCLQTPKKYYLSPSMISWPIIVLIIWTRLSEWLQNDRMKK